MAEPTKDEEKKDDEKALSATAEPPKEKTAADHAADAALSAAEAAKSAAALSGGAPADQQVALAEPAAEAGAAEVAEEAAEAGDDVDAGSVFDALAEAAGMSKAEVLAKMADEIDRFVALLQDPNAKAMSATSVDKDIRALRIELKQFTTREAALLSRVAAAEAKLKATEDKAKADKEASIKSHVVELQRQGKVGPEEQDIEDAVFMFTQNFERASRTYSKQIVPVGEPETKDERNSKATTTVTLDNLSERELRTVNFLVDSGIARDQALQKIGEQRSAGKGN